MGTESMFDTIINLPNSSSKITLILPGIKLPCSDCVSTRSSTLIRLRLCCGNHDSGTDQNENWGQNKYCWAKLDLKTVTQKSRKPLSGEEMRTLVPTPVKLQLL